MTALRDLDAQFVGHVVSDLQLRSYRRQGNQVEGAQGVLFQCPVCSVGLEEGTEDGRHFYRGAHYVLVWFRNPRNAPNVPAEVWPKPRWTFTGDTLDTLTLTPSINLIDDKGNTTCWHGHVTNGQTT